MTLAFRVWTVCVAAALAAVTGGAAGAASLDVAAQARWSGDFGLAVGLDGAAATYLETTTPSDEGRYRVRFYFNADTASLGPSGSVVLFRALSAALAPVVSVILESDGGSGGRLLYSVAASGGPVSTPAIAVAPGWHFLELDWVAATAPGAGDGSLTTRLDDAPTPGLTALDNDQSRVALARWGAVAVAAGPSGTVWLDDFASRRSGAIGPVLAGSLDLDGNGSLDASTDGLIFVRSAFGITGSALIQGAIGDGCRYCDAPAIESRLTALRAVLDVDDDGAVHALTDALLLFRHLFGMSGAPLVQGAIGNGAVRGTPAAVTGYLDTLE